MLETFPRPILLAHRGDSAHAPENTLPAFEQALQKGADGIELDAKLSADGQIVVIHDATANRTTDGAGKVSELSFAELRAFDAGAWFDAKFSGVKIPLLEEVFETVGQDKIINIELTNYHSPWDGLTAKVCESIKRCGNAEQILLSSFFPFNLNIARRLLPQIPRGLLALPGARGLWARSFGFMFGDYQALHPNISDLRRESVQRAHRLKRRVHVWTANASADVQRLRDWGADGIITDDPQAAAQALGRK